MDYMIGCLDDEITIVLQLERARNVGCIQIYRHQANDDIFFAWIKSIP